MSKESQYLILNTQMKVIGVTDINGATPFSGDLITRQIADTDNTTDVSDGVENYNTNNDPNANSKNWNHTGEITVAEGYPDSYKVAANNYLMYWDNNAQHYYLMYISQETDAGTDASGRHINTYQLENVLITNMNDYIPLKATFKDVDAETAFTALFTDSNWKLDFQAKTALLGTIKFDGTTNAMNYLQSLLQTYDVEMDAYAELYSDGNIKNLVVKIVDKLGTDKHHWVADYGGDNILGITRTTVYSNVVTKLHVLNGNGNSIADVNDGKDYLVNDEANRTYNPNWQHGTYLEGTVTFPTVLNHSAIKSLGQRQLYLFSHPRVSYEVTPSARFNPGLGDNIRGTDRKMEPELVIDARTISVSHSKADYTKNLVQFGEFVPVKVVTPNAILQLRNELNTNISNLITEAKNDINLLTSSISTPDGTSFAEDEESKRAIAKVFINSVDVTNYCLPHAFIWSLNNPDGTPNIDWANRWDNGAKGGYLQCVDESTFGDLQLNVDLDAISNVPEIALDEKPNTQWISSYNIQKIRFDSALGYIYFFEGNKLHRTKDFGKTIETMTINNLLAYDFSVDSGHIYMMNSTNGIICFDFIAGYVGDISIMTNTIFSLTHPYHFDYDAKNNMLALMSGKQIYIVQDNSNDSNPYYYIKDYTKWGIKANVTDFVLKYPNIYMLCGNHEVVGFNVINQSPIFEHPFTYDSGMPTGTEVSLAQDSNHFYIATNTTDYSASTELVDLPADLRAEPTAITEDPSQELVPNAIESAGFSSLDSKLASVQNSETVSFAYITDTHVSGYGSDTQHTVCSLRHLKAISYYAKHNNSIKMVVHNGDLDDGEVPIQDTMNDVDMSIEAMQLSGKPFVVSQGNHDDNSGYARDYAGRLVAQVFDPQKSYAHRINKFSQYIKINPYDRTNMYGTYALTSNIDMIFLNSFDLPYSYSPSTVETWVAHQRSAFMQRQITWLINTLNAEPSDHQVIIVTHSPIRDGAISNSSFVIKQRNGNLISGILEAFQNGKKYSSRGWSWAQSYPQMLNEGVFSAEANVDFSGRTTGRIIAVLSGHTHEDKDNMHKKVLYTQTLDSLPGRCPRINRNIGDETEDAWDIVTVDPSARKIYFSRYGAGNDRSYSY